MQAAHGSEALSSTVGAHRVAGLVTCRGHGICTTHTVHEQTTYEPKARGEAARSARLFVGVVGCGVHGCGRGQARYEWKAVEGGVHSSPRWGMYVWVVVVVVVVVVAAGT